MDKAIIARRFSKASVTYNENATVQAKVAEQLAGMLAGTSCKVFEKAMEIGCGTGLFTKFLTTDFQIKSLILNDLYKAKDIDTYLENPENSFIEADAEILEMPDNLDLIASCSTMQWFENQPVFIAKCHKSLKDSGVLAIATYGPDNMWQMKKASGVSLHYYSMEELTALLKRHFHKVEAIQEHYTLAFNSPMEVLRHIKATGVAGITQTSWGKDRCKAFCNAYSSAFGNADGSVNLTYHPILLIASDPIPTNER